MCGQGSILWNSLPFFDPFCILFDGKNLDGGVDDNVSGKYEDDNNDDNDDDKNYDDNDDECCIEGGRI